MLGRNVVHEQQHPRPQRLNRRHRLGKFPLRRRQLRYLAAIDRLKQRFPRRKMAIQRSRSNACILGNIVQVDVRPVRPRPA